MKDLEKSLKSLYNDDDIKIPNSLREKVNKIYEDIESKSKKKVRNNFFKVAGLFIALLIGINFVKPSFAEELPIFGPVLKVLNNKWGLGIKYTENGLSVKEEFYTENHTVTIEAIDFDGSQLLMTYKVESKIEFDNLIIYGIMFDINGEEFNVEQNGGLATGGPDEDGIYYGYSVTKLSFENSAYNNEEITVGITPKAIRYIAEEDTIEEINNSRELKLTIKNKNYR